MPSFKSSFWAFCASLLLFLALPRAGYSQSTGAVEGTVRAIDGTALRGVELVIEGTEKVTRTGPDGSFLISRIPSGSYRVTARTLGYAPVSRQISVSPDRATRLEIALSVTATELGQITVMGNRRYGASNSGSALKMDVPVLDVPQSIVVISEDFMNDQNATTLDDLMRNVAGISPFSDYQDFTARGFRQGEDEVTYNGTRSNAVNFFGTPNLYNIEKVEVLKGPSGVLYGALEGGALINMVTKSPKATPVRTLTLSGGRYSNFSGAADVTGPFKNTDKLLYRLNAHYADSKSFRRFLETTNWHIAPSLTWLPRRAHVSHVERRVSRGRQERRAKPWNSSAAWRPVRASSRLDLQ